MENYKVGTVSESYPDSVQELVNMTMDVTIQHDLLEGIDPAVLEGLLCDIALKKFLGDGEMTWTEKEYIDSLSLAMAHTQINKLKDMGLIDSIENEDGEEVVWITDTGRELISTIDKTQLN